MIVLRCLALVLALGAVDGAARAAEPVPANSSALEKRLQSYDPRAVAAARHYYGMPALKTGMIAMVDNLDKAMIAMVAKQNPNLSPQQAATIQKIVGDAMKARIDLLQDMSMVIALDTFTTDELVALDKFYSSPEGSSVVAKLPKLTAQMPAMIQSIMPDYLNEIKTKVKSAGAELKL